MATDNNSTAENPHVSNRLMNIVRCSNPNRIVRRTLVVAFLIGGSWLYVFIYDNFRIIRLDSIYSPATYRDAELIKQRIFSQKIPSLNEIDDYLSDATVVVSHPPVGNAVYYFDSDRKIFWWHGDQISTGVWKATPNVQLIIFGTQWRLAIVYKFCWSFSDRVAIEQQDSCYYLTSLDWIFSFANSHREYRKGDLFGLDKVEKGQVGKLPESNISIEQLLATERERNG
jgi:hypothetical protein